MGSTDVGRRKGRLWLVFHVTEDKTGGLEGRSKR